MLYRIPIVCMDLHGVINKPLCHLTSFWIKRPNAREKKFLAIFTSNFSLTTYQFHNYPNASFIIIYKGNPITINVHGKINATNGNSIFTGASSASFSAHQKPFYTPLFSLSRKIGPKFIPIFSAWIIAETKFCIEAWSIRETIFLSASLLEIWLFIV